MAYTDENGAFRMRALIPGTFEVRATAAKLSPVVQKDVQVGITAPAELTFVMEVQTTADEIIVVQKAPLVSTTRANVTEDFSSEFVEALPHRGRDNIHRDMLGSVAGSVANRMRGGAANQTIVTQDGFDMGPPGKTISPSLKSSAAFEIQTAGYGADNPTASGGVLNLVTRSGLEPLRVRAQRHRRQQRPPLLPRRARRPHRHLLLRHQPDHRRARSSRTSSGSSSTPRPTSPRTAARRTSRGSSPIPCPPSGSSRRARSS